MKIRTKKATVRVEVDGVIFEVAQITHAEINLVKARHTVTDRKGKQEVDINFVGQSLFDKRVVGWVGDITDEEGKLLVCNTATKALLWEYDNEFAGRIMGAANDALEAREDLDGKN